MSYELVSLDNRSVSLSISPGNDISLGRQAQLGVTNKGVSREHCALHCLKSTEGQDPSVLVTARKKCYVSGPAREQCTLLPGKSTQLSVKDIVYLSNDGGTPGDGFRLQQSAGHRKLAKTPSGGSQKRWRSSPCVKGEAPADVARSKCMRVDPTPSLAGDDEAAPPEEQAVHYGVFAGLRFLFWVVAFTGPLKTGAQKAGATVADELDSGVTHVIAQKGTSAKQASAKLQIAGTHSPVLRVEGEELVDLPAGVHFVTKEWVGDCLGQGKLLPEGRYLIDLAQMALLAKLQGPSSAGSLEEGSGMDAEAVAVATSGSPFKSPHGQPSVVKNDKGVALQAITMQTWLKRIQQALSRSGEGSELAMPPRMAALWRMHTPLEHHSPLGMEGEWKLWQESGLGFPVSQQMQESSQGDQYGPLHAPPSTAAFPGSPQSQEDPRSAQHAQTTSRPGSEAAAADSIEHHPWGEPYNVQAAQATKKMLYDHYHKQDPGKYAHLHSPNKGSAPVASPQKGLKVPSKAAVPHALAGSEDEDNAGGGNTECSHTACSAKTFCIVRHLRDIKNNYIRDRERYSKLAMDVIMGRVEALTEPLQSAEDCDCVRGEGVGRDNVDKLKEIVRTGAFRRNEQLAQDAHHQAIKLFLTVWGTGEKGAEMWWSQGCRTLQDLRGRDDLSAQQAAGLKYYEDMQQRIPREETATIEAVVREAVVDLLHCREAQDASTLFCHAVGSYIRGKPDTGDVDMLILPPESCVEVDSRLALYELLQILRRRGLMLEDMMAKEAPSEKGYGSATFLGLCRHASSPCVRRIDLKWYPRRYMPFALTHFIGSGLFNRALRYWARTATEAAKAVSEQADGFKLSEYGLVPIRKVKPGMKGAQSQHKSEEELGPCVGCTLESDIFRALGLAYVPFHLRWWYGYE